jgi:hypothetical protein
MPKATVESAGAPVAPPWPQEGLVHWARTTTRWMDNDVRGYAMQDRTHDAGGTNAAIMRALTCADHAEVRAALDVTRATIPG